MPLPDFVYVLVDRSKTWFWPEGLTACEFGDLGPFYPSEVPYFETREDAERAAVWRQSQRLPRRLLVRMGVFLAEQALYYDPDVGQLPPPRRRGTRRAGREEAARATKGAGERSACPGHLGLVALCSFGSLLGEVVCYL